MEAIDSPVRLGWLASAVPDWREFCAGAASGAAGVAAGNPCDVLRVRLQQQGAPGAPRYAGAADCARQLLRREGARALFKGMGGPLVTAGLQNAIVFTTYEGVSRALKERRGLRPAERLGLLDVWLAGTAAGCVQTVVLTPVDLIKVRRQLMSPGGSREHSASEVMRAVMRREGLIGLWRGQLTMLWRDSPSTGLWYCAYQLGLDALAGRNSDGGAAPVHAWAALLAGGMAGCISWASVYPIDLVKTRLQARPEGSPWESPLREARRIAAREGPGAFFVGFGMTMAKAFCCSAVIFPVYELSSHWLKKA